MAFKSKQVAGNGTTEVVVLTSPANSESVIFSLTAYNSGSTDSTLELILNNITIYSTTVTADSVYNHTAKISVAATETFSLKTDSSVQVNVAYLERAVDALSVSSDVQTVLDMKSSIDAVYADLSNINIAVASLPQINASKENALTAQSAANYKGIWSNTYSGGYAVGDSVKYTDGRRYVSNVGSNTEEPTTGSQWEKVNIDAWNYQDTNSDYSAEDLDFVFIDTSANIVNITLPLSPIENTKIGFKDINGTFSTNNLAVKGNGNTIMGLSEDMTGSTDNMKFVLIFKNNDWRLL